MTVTIERLDHYGRGISHIDGKVVFVQNSLPNEEVEIEIDNETSKYMEAHVIEYKTKSPKRVKSKCPYYGTCGGCHLRHMSYDDTLEFKKNKVTEILKKYANQEVEPILVKNKNRDFYRNKIEIKVENGVYGFYKKDSHELIEIDRCINAEEPINTILRSTNLLNIENGTVTVKTNYNDEIILNIEADNEASIGIDKLREKCKLVGIIYNKKLIFGADHFIETINGMLFKETYNSFFQVNRYINGELFKLVEANIKDGSVVVDMCSGVGTLSILASKKASKVYSLEIVENSIKDGLLNAKINKKDNIEFMLGDAYTNISKIKDNIDTFLIDPPRSGLNKVAIDTILNKEPKSIIYISCDPLTLSRDLKMLGEKYTVEKVYVLDMFSYTYHVETIALLQKSNRKCASDGPRSKLASDPNKCCYTTRSLQSFGRKPDTYVKISLNNEYDMETIGIRWEMATWI